MFPRLAKKILDLRRKDLRLAIAFSLRYELQKYLKDRCVRFCEGPFYQILRKCLHTYRIRYYMSGEQFLRSVARHCSKIKQGIRYGRIFKLIV